MSLLAKTACENLKDVPAEWATVSIQLLAKSEKLTDPAEFKANCSHEHNRQNLLCGCAKRLEKHMLENTFISDIQKGFKAETPLRCLRHFLMQSPIKDKLLLRCLICAMFMVQ